MLEMPRSLMSTWLVLLPALLHQLFQRLGHDLYQTTTTKHVGDGQEGTEREMREPPAGTLQFSPGLGKWAPAGRVRGQGGGWGGRDREWEASSTIPAAETEANTRATPHTYSLRRAAPNRLRVGTGFCRAHAGGERCTRAAQSEQPNEEHALSRHSAQAHTGPLSAPRPARARRFPN